MKRSVIAFCGALYLLLVGCVGEGEQRAFSAHDVTSILDAEIFSEELETVETDLVCKLYGLDQSVLDSCTAYLSTGATAEEVVLFQLSDAKNTEIVKVACEKRLADQIKAYESYNPGEVAKLKDAVLQVRKNTVLLVVSNDSAGAAAAVDDLQ